MELKQIDVKHHVEFTNLKGIQIIKSSNGEAIPDDEPIILFRGRDKLALPMLKYYRSLCVADSCTDYQIDSMNEIIRRFDTFSINSPTMKQPGISLGK